MQFDITSFPLHLFLIAADPFDYNIKGRPLHNSHPKLTFIEHISLWFKFDIDFDRLVSLCISVILAIESQCSRNIVDWDGLVFYYAIVNA